MAQSNQVRFLVIGCCLLLAGCASQGDFSSLGTSLGGLLGGQAQQPDRPSVAQIGVTECDRLTAIEIDPGRVTGVVPVAWKDLDAGKAISACQQALAAYPEHPRLLVQLARAYQRAYRQSEAYAATLKSANHGYAYAVYSMGYLHETSIGVPQDYKAAESWYRKAAPMGIPHAWNRIGILYADKYQPADTDKAIDAFRRAAKTGYISGMTNAAALLAQRGGRGDASEALSWAQKAAESGDAAGMRMVGAYYHNREEYAKALPWYQQAAKAGDAAAMNTLASYYRVGGGVVRPDMSTALMYYERAAKAGYAPAAVRLAMIYAKGSGGILPDQGKAMYWFKYGIPSAPSFQHIK